MQFSQIHLDDGDGSFHEEQKCKTKYKEVPVYGQYCSYDIEKWATDRTAKESGTDLSPKWPTVSIKECSMVRLGCKRKGPKTETYTVHFVDEKAEEKYTCDFPEAKWKGYSVGSAWDVEVNLMGSMQCDTLKQPSK